MHQRVDEVGEVLEVAPVEVEREDVGVRADGPGRRGIAVQEPGEPIGREERGPGEHEQVGLGRAEPRAVPVEDRELAVVAEEQVRAPQVGVAQDHGPGIGTRARDVAERLQALDGRAERRLVRQQQVRDDAARRVGRR